MGPAIACVTGYRRLAAPRMKLSFLSMVPWETPKRRAANRYAAHMTAGRMQRDVQRWSRVYDGPYIAIGRLGAFGCAVMAAGGSPVHARARDGGGKSDSGAKGLYDPIDHVAAMQRQPGRRMIVMSDPDDQLVSFHSQWEFAERVRAKSLPILHVSADSGTESFHG